MDLQRIAKLAGIQLNEGGDYGSATSFDMQDHPEDSADEDQHVAKDEHNNLTSEALSAVEDAIRAFADERDMDPEAVYDLVKDLLDQRFGDAVDNDAASDDTDDMDADTSGDQEFDDDIKF